MNSLLRDVLAALLLISLGLFSRVGKSHDVLASNDASMLFRALSVYLVISLALQLLFICVIYTWRTKSLHIGPIQHEHS